MGVGFSLSAMWVPKTELGLVIKLDSKHLYLMHHLTGSPVHSDVRQALEDMAICTKVVLGIWFRWVICCCFSVWVLFFIIYLFTEFLNSRFRKCKM